MARTVLPSGPGFRFHPTDVELVMYYLKRKVMQKFHFDAISELNIYKFSPWDLPDKSCMRSKDLEWYFFCPREKKYASGSRANRSTETGFWKTTGKDRKVLYKERTVGVIKTLVFHKGHAPGGERTNWVMYEYGIVDKDLFDEGVVLDAFVICKVFQKSGSGPKNNAHYGAPFNEDEWNDDSETCVESLPSDGMPSAAPALPDNQNNSVVTGMGVPESTCTWASCDPGPSTAVPSAEEMSPVLPEDDELDSLLAMFTEDGTLLPFETENNEKCDDLDRNKTTYSAVSSLDGHDIYKGLGDLGNCEELRNGLFDFSSSQEAGYVLDPMLPGGNGAFFELNDLNSPLHFSAEQKSTDSLCAPLNCYNNLEEGCYGGNVFDAVQYGPCSSQLSKLPEGSNVQGGHSDVFQKGKGIMNSANQGCGSMHNVDFTVYRQPEGDREGAKKQKRGEQPTNSYSRLQQLLESIPARPASAAEHLAPMNSPCGSSSIHVKAEVTRRGDGCTKDALSVKLGESIHLCSRGCNLPRADLEKKVANCSSGFAFVFYLGMISALMWVFMIAFSTKLGRCARNIVIS